jgi:hypothetical protein
VRYFRRDRVGTAAPIEARPPEREHIIPRRILMSRAYQLAQEPESLVMIARSGSRGASSQATRCGFTGSAETWARSSISFHQAATFFSICSRQGFCHPKRQDRLAG